MPDILNTTNTTEAFEILERITNLLRKHDNTVLITLSYHEYQKLSPSLKKTNPHFICMYQKPNNTLQYGTTYLRDLGYNTLQQFLNSEC